tara:strand:+ start:3426 stop:4556 length:1131 start_codon:yes stop_codon:yes gene_type:complete
MNNKINAFNSFLKVDEPLPYTLLSNGVDGVGFCNLKNQENLIIDSKLAQHLECTKEEMYQSSFQQITHPDDLKIDNDLGDELLIGKRDRYQLEKRYFHKNGNIIWVILSVALVKDEKVNPNHYISQIHNITQRKNAEKRAESLYKITQARNQRLTSFAHIVSHNLRSHSGNLSMLFDLMDLDSSEALKNEILPLVGEAVKNLHETVDHLNEVIALNDQVSQHLKPLQLNTFIEKAIVNIKSIQLASKCKINNTIDPTITVLVLPAYLDSIILNFLSNAIKYKSPKRQPEISISSKQVDLYIVLSITDNGVGIDLKLHEKKLFGMYKTFHNHPDAQGIGLFLSKGQIEAIGGKIEVESKVDCGTTFKIYLKYENENI